MLKLLVSLNSAQFVQKYSPPHVCSVTSVLHHRRSDVVYGMRICVALIRSQQRF
jgi:hypothetical protein